MYYIKFGNIAFKFGLNKEKNFQWALVYKYI